MKKQLLIFGLLICLVASAAVKPVSSQIIVLKPGWNLVTLERPVIETDMAKFLSLKPMMFNAEGKCYVQCTAEADIKIGTGYWIFSKTGRTLEFVKDQNKTTWETTGLMEGWNLVGVADNSTWQDQATEIWQWLNGKFRKVAKEKLVLGKAYWVFL